MTRVAALSGKDMGGLPISNLGAPTNNGDATPKSYVDAGDANSRDRANHTGTQLASTISNFDSVVRLNRLDQMAIPTAPLNLNSQRIYGLAEPTAAADAATKNYVDGKNITGNTPDTWQVAATAGTTVTSTSATPLAGLSQTLVSNGLSDVFAIDMSLDVLINTNSTFVGELFVDGVVQASQGILSAANNSRLPVDKEFRVTGLAAGSHTFDIRGRQISTGSYTVNSQHSIMRVARIGQQFGDGPQVLAAMWANASTSGYTSVTDVPLSNTQHMLGGISYNSTTREFTVPTSGTYLMNGTVRWSAGMADSYQFIYVNGVEVARSKSTQYGPCTITTSIPLSAGDKVRFLTNQASGVSQTVVGDSGRDTSFRMVRVAGNVAATNPLGTRQRSADVSLPSGAYQIPFDTAEVADGITWDATNNRWVVVTAGRYSINYQAGFLVSANVQVKVGIVKNGTLGKRSLQQVNLGQFQTHSQSRIMRLAVGDTIGVQVLSSATGVTLLGGTDGYTFIDIAHID